MLAVIAICAFILVSGQWANRVQDEGRATEGHLPGVIISASDVASRASQREMGHLSRLSIGSVGM